MGVDAEKVPAKEQFSLMLMRQIELPLHRRNSYCFIWQMEEVRVGHSNLNPIKFGEEAYMHLHLWSDKTRQKGCGIAFVKMGLPYFFEKFQLQKIYCPPYALNPAPNKTLPKAGFEFVKEYITIPGYLNFEQPVKLWQLTLENTGNCNRKFLLKSFAEV